MEYKHAQWHKSTIPWRNVLRHRISVSMKTYPELVNHDYRDPFTDYYFVFEVMEWFRECYKDKTMATNIARSRHSEYGMTRNNVRKIITVYFKTSEEAITFKLRWG